MILLSIFPIKLQPVKVKVKVKVPTNNVSLSRARGRLLASAACCTTHSLPRLSSSWASEALLSSLSLLALLSLSSLSALSLSLLLLSSSSSSSFVIIISISIIIISLVHVIILLMCLLLLYVVLLGLHGFGLLHVRGHLGRGQIGIDTNGTAAKVMNFDRSGKNVRPGTFGEIKVGYREYPKVPLSKNMKCALTPLVLTPFVPFRAPARS